MSALGRRSPAPAQPPELAGRQLAQEKPAPARLVVVELGQLVRRLRPRLRPLLGDAVELEVVAAGASSRCEVELGLLEELVFGLLDGCLEAMPHGGRLRIETGSQLVSEGDSAARVPSGCYAVLSLFRHSAGVDDSELPRQFEPVTARLVFAGLDEADASEPEAECGYLVAEQGPARGTMRIYLPSTDEPVSRGARRKPSGLPGGFETVLLVEDSRATRVSARRLLRARGYHVIEAGSAQQAVLASRRHAGRIAALVTDVVLADMNGYVLAERLRAERPELKLLFMTSYPGRSEGAGIRLVGTEVVHKPFTAAALCRALRGLLDERA